MLKQVTCVAKNSTCRNSRPIQELCHTSMKIKMYKASDEVKTSNYKAKYHAQQVYIINSETIPKGVIAKC